MEAVAFLAALVDVDVSEDQGASVAASFNSANITSYCIAIVLRADLPLVYATCSRMYASSITAIHNILHLIN
jgi:hypothetical protein